MQRLSIFIVLLALLALGPGCGNHPRIAGLTESSVVLAFGDSLTVGEGASATENYPAVLAKRLGCRVVNAGVSGETSSEGVLRLPAVLRQEKVSLVILCEGGNDMLQKQADDTISKNLDAMVARVRESGTDAILIGVPKPGFFNLKAPLFYQQIASKNGILCDSETLPEILSKSSLKSDYVHPNAEGYRKMAGAIADLIQTNQRDLPK